MYYEREFDFSEREDRREAWSRLTESGLQGEANEYKKERIKYHQAERDPASLAWEDMWDKFGPMVPIAKRMLEKQKAKKEEESVCVHLVGFPTNVDSVIDPEYTEKSQAKQLKDGLLWAAMEFCRVIHDDKDGPIANIDAASAKPPNAFALFTLSTYALSPIDKRRDLIARALAFADKSGDGNSTINPAVQHEMHSGGPLDDLG